MSSAADRKRARIAAAYQRAQAAQEDEQRRWEAEARAQVLARAAQETETLTVEKALNFSSSGGDGDGGGGKSGVSSVVAGSRVHVHDGVSVVVRSDFAVHPREFHPQQQGAAQEDEPFAPQLVLVSSRRVGDVADDGEGGEGEEAAGGGDALVRRGVDLVALTEHWEREWPELKFSGFSVRAARLFAMFLKLRVSLGQSQTTPKPIKFWVHDVAAAAWVSALLRPVAYARNCAKLFAEPAGTANSIGDGATIDPSYAVHFDLDDVDFVQRKRAAELRARASVDSDDSGSAVSAAAQAWRDLDESKSYVEKEWLEMFGESLTTSIQRTLYSASASEDERLAGLVRVKSRPSGQTDAQAEALFEIEKEINEDLAVAISADTKWLPHIKAYNFSAARNSDLRSNLAKRRPLALPPVPAAVGALWFVAQQQQPFEEFLYLAFHGDGKSAEGGLLNPPGSVDVLWHAAMLSPLHYAEACRQMRSAAVPSHSGPFILDHVPWPEVDTSTDTPQPAMQQKDFDPMLARWRAEFGWVPDESVFAGFGNFDVSPTDSGASVPAALPQVDVRAAVSHLLLFVDGLTLAKLRLLSRSFAQLIDSPVGDIYWSNALQRDFGRSHNSARHEYQREWQNRRDRRPKLGSSAPVDSPNESSESSDDDLGPTIRPFPHPHRPHPPIHRPYVCGAPENTTTSDCCIDVITTVVRDQLTSESSDEVASAVLPVDFGLGIDDLVAEVSQEVDERVTANRGMFFNQIEECVGEALQKRRVGDQGSKTGSL